MATRDICVKRFSVISSRPFSDVATRLEAAFGHPDMRTFFKDISSAKTYPEVEGIVQRAIGTSSFMQFARFDLGEVLRKELGEKAPRSLRYLIGNPLIMKEMVEHLPDAGSYAPVTILIDERPVGVHLSYDSMVSYLAPYGNPDATKVAQDLDSKVSALLATAAG
jgi:uncharacterized protein (DUF302 family)